MKQITRLFLNTKFIMMSEIVFVLMVQTFVMTCPAYADNWKDFSGAEKLQKFVAGASAEIELKKGVVATGKYYEDGTAEIKAWDEIFPRTWEVRGDDQVCYSSETETNITTSNLNKPQIQQFVPYS
jgi:hypothetical protein